MEISAASSVWFGKNSLFIVGGTEPPLGNGGRSIFIYTSHNISVDTCDAKECIMNPNADTDSRMVYCDGEACERWMHIVCDPSLKKKKKLPEKYFCTFCCHSKKKKLPQKAAVGTVVS